MNLKVFKEKKEVDHEILFKHIHTKWESGPYFEGPFVFNRSSKYSFSEHFAEPIF